jgi:hypothetical protein
MASPKMIAAVTELRRDPQHFFARENHDEQRINAFPKNRAPLDKKRKKIPVGPADLPPVLPDRQSVVLPVHRRLPGIVVLRPQGRRGGLGAELISSAAPEAC